LAEAATVNPMVTNRNVAANKTMTFFGFSSRYLLSTLLVAALKLNTEPRQSKG
jgi:hypothetical protein